MKAKKGSALATILVLMVVMIAFVVGLMWVIGYNYKKASFESRKSSALTLAQGAIDYMINKYSDITWTQVSQNIYTSGEVHIDSPVPNPVTGQLGPPDQYYFEIRDTQYGTSNSGEYLFIGVIKNRAGDREISRKVLKVDKSNTEFLPTDLTTLKKVWTE